MRERRAQVSAGSLALLLHAGGLHLGEAETLGCCARRDVDRSVTGPGTSDVGLTWVALPWSLPLLSKSTDEKRALPLARVVEK